MPTWNDAGPLPERIGRFAVRGLLGEGATSRVLLGWDPHLEREVAIKWQRDGAEGAGDVLHEARVVAGLAHPNIVPLYEAGVFRTSPYLVFARVRGETLREWRLRNGPPAPERALSLMRGILDGVACAHAAGIAHLDLSPSNILVDEDGVPRVMDFGLARRAARAVPGGARGTVTGTPMYMAPERLFGLAATARSDVFSLGLVFHELLTGRPALPADSLEAIAVALGGRTLPLPALEEGRLDPALKAALRGALDLDPARRYADAAQMRARLDRLVRAGERAQSHATVEFLLGRMERKANFPALSSNLIEINRMTEDASRASVDALARVVLRDYAVTNRLLKLANSSFFGRGAAGVATVSEAIQRLGFRAVRLTCNSLAYLNALGGGGALLRDAMAASFAAALLARHLALRLGRADLAEEAFVCGLFARLGRCLTIFYFEEEFTAIERLMATRGLREADAAVRVLGISYGDLALAVAARWKFPEAIQGCVREIDGGILPAPASDAQALRQIAAFAAELCDLATRGPEAEAAPRLEALARRFAALLAIDAVEAGELLRAALERLGAFSQAVGLGAPGGRFAVRANLFAQHAARRAPERLERSMRAVAC